MSTTNSGDPPFKRPNKPIEEQRVAILGAGPSGLSALCAFKEESAATPQVVCFERQPESGGQWNYTWRTTVDEYGEPAHSGMYRHLWSNGPKECLEFANYTFQQHFQKNIGSYPPRKVLQDYIVGRAKHFGLLDNIRFQTAVRRVTFDEETQEFTVCVQDLKTSVESSQTFDYVICATGHFHVPNVPSFPGLETFDGRVIHSHDIRSWEDFSDKRLLVIGTSYSAEDVVVQGYKFGCRDITVSYRTAPMPFHWPEGVVTKPLLEKVEGSVATFNDGSTKEVDVIVLSTGYHFSFPFLEDKLKLKTANRLWIENCHKGIFWNDNPRMIYIGMQDQWLTFNMFDAQAWYARDVILGKIEIPTERKAEIERMKTKEDEKPPGDEPSIRFQVDYTAELVEATDYPSWDYELTVQTFLDWEHSKHEDIFCYRDTAHKSAFTGDEAPKVRVPWKENMDDSIEAYLKN